MTEEEKYLADLGISVNQQIDCAYTATISLKTLMKQYKSQSLTEIVEELGEQEVFFSERGENIPFMPTRRTVLGISLGFRKAIEIVNKKLNKD